MKRNLQHLLKGSLLLILAGCAPTKRTETIQSDCLKNFAGDHYLCSNVDGNNNLVVTIFNKNKEEIYRRNTGAIGSAKWENDSMVKVTLLPANPRVNQNKMSYLIDIKTGKLIPLNQENREKE
ncbi:hypothetical protein [Ekhidna sp.]|uniref:hypothetical protein n=1 Tax=Ekhidna sp. TaxID=2608089 RepID=UPI0032EAD5E5